MLKDTIAITKKQEKEFQDYTGKAFADSPTQIRNYFLANGIKSPKKTKKGAESFDAEALEMINHPVAEIIVTWRKANKLAGTYYSTLLDRQDATGRIHANIRQGGTGPGRMSYAEPNLQNVPKVDEDAPESGRVRRCFIPAPGYCFFMPDYDQMEYRLMLDQAGETKIIDMILNDGLDVHTATGREIGVNREAAKTINFMLLYGGGIQKLAHALGVPFSVAKQIRKTYFARLPQVQKWIRSRIRFAERHGYIINCAGRMTYIDRQFAYKAPNYDIQGGCGVIMKKAMNEVGDLLRNCKSRMQIQIHDELLLSMHKDELDLCPKIVKIMEGVYRCRSLPLTAGPKFSWKSWADPQKGYPK